MYVWPCFFPPKRHKMAQPYEHNSLRTYWCVLGPHVVRGVWKLVGNQNARTGPLTSRLPLPPSTHPNLVFHLAAASREKHAPFVYRCLARTSITSTHSPWPCFLPWHLGKKQGFPCPCPPDLGPTKRAKAYHLRRHEGRTNRSRRHVLSLPRPFTPLLSLHRPLFPLLTHPTHHNTKPTAAGAPPQLPPNPSPVSFSSSFSPRPLLQRLMPPCPHPFPPRPWAPLPCRP